MTDESIKNHDYEKLKDQFTSTTRTVRRNLLVSSALSIILFSIGGEITTLFGINFGKNVPIDIPLGALCIVVIYEFITFVSYGIIDYKSWSLKPNEITYNFSDNKLDLLSKNFEGINKEIKNKKIEMQHFVFSGGNTIPIEFEAMPMPVPDSLPENLDPEIAKTLEAKAFERISNHIKEENIRVSTEIERIVTSFEEEIKEELKEKTNEIEMKLTSSIKNLDDINKEITTHEENIKSYRKAIKKLNFYQLFRIYFIDWSIPIMIGVLGIYLNFHSIKFLYDILLKQLTLTSNFT